MLRCPHRTDVYGVVTDYCYICDDSSSDMEGKMQKYKTSSAMELCGLICSIQSLRPWKKKEMENEDTEYGLHSSFFLELIRSFLLVLLSHERLSPLTSTTKRRKRKEEREREKGRENNHELLRFDKLIEHSTPLLPWVNDIVQPAPITCKIAIAGDLVLGASSRMACNILLTEWEAELYQYVFLSVVGCFGKLSNPTPVSFVYNDARVCEVPKKYESL